jgi:hypothetical protein
MLGCRKRIILERRILLRPMHIFLIKQPAKRKADDSDEEPKEKAPKSGKKAKKAKGDD